MNKRPTLEQWIEKYSAAKFLRDNLRANLDALTDLSEQEKEVLMRANMIMVRQFGRDCGLE